MLRCSYSCFRFDCISLNLSEVVLDFENTSVSEYHLDNEMINRSLRVDFIMPIVLDA